MRYIDIVKTAPKKSEEIMWDSIKDISDLVDDLWKVHPEMAKNFMMKSYSKMHGEHFNETLAREFVDAMFHYNANDEKIKGEMVSVEESTHILEPMDKELLRWDAYVACNSMMHDMARSGMSNASIMDATRVFWFEDDDFDGESKVFWYFSNR